MNLRTVELPVIRQLTKLTGTYLADFADGMAEHGQVAFLHGDHGAGKTHAVLHTLCRAPELAPARKPLPGPPYRFYVKAEDHDVIALYQRLMGQLDLAALRELSLRFLGTIASEETRRAHGPRAGAKFLEQVSQRPDQVYALYDELPVEPGAVLQSQAAELAGVVGGWGEDFQRALTYLLDPALEAAAYAWLTGRDVTAGDASRLGVKGPITEARVCRYGIQLLVSMCARVRRPVILVLDQCERLVLDRNDDPCQQNIGLLHSLVEVVPKDNGMLILVGSDDAWWALPRDFRQRVGGNEMLATILAPDHATELLAVYISAVTRKKTADGPYPFTPDAIHALLEVSGGNARRLLQEAWEVFDRTPKGQEITREAVQRGAGQGRGGITAEEARRAIEQVLLDMGVIFEQPWRQGSMQADYGVLVDSQPRVLIRIVHPVFYDDEAREALGSMTLLRQVRREGMAARVILVVLGYCSPDVLSTLGWAAHDVIVYDGPAAAERLRDIVGQLPSYGGGSPATAADHDRLEEVYDALHQAATARDEEVRALRAELSGLLDRFAESAEPRGRVRWTQRQQQLRDRIRDERRVRGIQELTDLQSAHATAERDRRTRFFVGGALAGLPVVVLGAGSWPATVGRGLGVALVALGCAAALLSVFVRLVLARYSSRVILFACAAGFSVAAVGAYLFWATAAGFYYENLPIVQALLILLGLAIAGGCVLEGLSVLRPRKAKELARQVDSVERLTQMARSYLGDTEQPRPALLNLLRHEDPHFRYAGVMAVRSEPARSARYGHVLARLFVTEPTVIVRRAVARALADVADSGLVRYVLSEGMREAIPEVVYLLEGAKDDAIGWLTENPRPETAAEVLALSRRAEPGARRLLTVVAGTAEPKLRSSLRHWYENERELKPGPELRRVPERFLRRAASLLSPFEKGGLGTFDELNRIADVDDLYLFFEQLIFYRELTFDEG